MANDAGLDRVAPATMECLGECIRARSGSKCAVADVALRRRDNDAPLLQCSRQNDVLIGVLHHNVDQRPGGDLRPRIGRPHQALKLGSLIWPMLTTRAVPEATAVPGMSSGKGIAAV